MDPLTILIWGVVALVGLYLLYVAAVVLFGAVFKKFFKDM